MRVMSCNIRYLNDKDGDHAWAFRRELLARTIRSRDPDLIGFQECWRAQLDYLLDALPGYDWFGICDTIDNERPMNAMFWRRDAFKLVSPGGFWLSETPHISGSSSWNSACVRFVNWLRLKQTTDGREFRFINTHLDHKSAPARDQQARLIVEDAAAYPVEYPQILTGDMNETRDKPGIGRFLAAGWQDTHRCVHGDSPDPCTIHKFKGEHCEPPHRKIDWIFTRGPLCATAAEVVRDHDGPLYPSDHYFLSTDLTF